jgi:serine/threonine protein kinase, bacterial
MSDDRKEGGLVKLIGGAIVAVLVAMLTAQNAPWWLPKVESIIGNSYKKPSTQMIPSQIQPTTLFKEGSLTAKEPDAKINVRAGAGTDFENLHYGIVGDKVIVISSDRDGANSTWYQIKFSSGAQGWVHEDFINVK